MKYCLLVFQNTNYLIIITLLQLQIFDKIATATYGEQIATSISVTCCYRIVTSNTVITILILST